MSTVRLFWAQTIICSLLPIEVNWNSKMGKGGLFEGTRVIGRAGECLWFLIEF